MLERFPILLAAETLPLEMIDPSAVRPGGPKGQSLPALEAALIIAISMILVLAISRRQQRKRKAHLPRNPTLAETGGLPPPRRP